MKITKRQLRRIIKEAGGFRDYGEDEIEYTSLAGTVGETHPEYQDLPQSDIDYYELADDYAMWVEDFGQGVENPSRPDVMASYFLEKGLEDDHAKHEMLGKAFQVSHADIMKELELQAADQKAAEEILSTRIGNYSSSRFAKKANEGVKVKITKSRLKEIIKEEKARLLKESFSSDALSQLDRAIAYNKKRAASNMAPEMIQMHDDDAYSLESIRDMAVQDRDDGYLSGSEPLRDLVSRLDTIVREQIPQEIYYWIIGEDY